MLSFKLSIGKVGIAEVPMYTNEAIAALPIRAGVPLDASFLSWSLRSTDLAQGGDRAAMGVTLNKSKLLAIPIPLPPLAEQRRIAAILDAADALRAKRRATIAALDTLTQSIFLELLGSSEPRGLSALPAGLSPADRRRGREARESLCRRWSARAKDPDVKPGVLDLSDLVRFSPQSNDGRLAKSKLMSGDLVIARTGRPGTAAVIPPELEGANAIDLLVVTPDPRVALRRISRCS